jgi:hypothetical protein
LNAKAGARRTYIGRKWALFGELGWDGYIDPEVGIQYSNGTIEKKIRHRNKCQSKYWYIIN